jgi:hypothetical protein
MDLYRHLAEVSGQEFEMQSGEQGLAGSASCSTETITLTVETADSNERAGVLLSQIAP